MNLALTRLIEMLGEAANRVPEEVRNRYPDLPWLQMIAALHPASTLITWDGKIYHPGSEAGGKATSWSGRLRSFLEHLVSRVG